MIASLILFLFSRTVELQVLVYEALAGQLECILPTSSSSYTEAQMKEVDNMAALVHSLRFELKTISELFCLATDPYKLFDLSLRIIHVARNSDTQLINKLWKSLLYRLVPEKAVSEIGQLFLETKRTAGDVIIDRRYQCRSVLFESEMQADGRGRSSDSWLHELQAKVLQMAQVLLREDGADETAASARLMGTNSVLFPVGLIMDECEELSTYLELACRQSASAGAVYAVKRGWVMDMLHDAGFSCGSLIETAVARLQQSEGRRVECTLRYIASVIYLLDKWIVLASGNGAEGSGRGGSALASMEQMGLLQAIRAQSVRHWCDRLRHHIHVLSGHHMALSDKQLIDSYSNELKLIEQKVVNLVIA